MSPNRAANSMNATKSTDPAKGRETRTVSAGPSVLPYRTPLSKADQALRAANKVLADFTFVKCVVTTMYRDGTEITQYKATFPGSNSETLVSETDLRLWQVESDPLVIGTLRQSQIDARGTKRLGLEAPVRFDALDKESQKVILMTNKTFRKEKPEESSSQDEE